MRCELTRRELIRSISSATVIWPLAARAQPPAGMRHIGMLMAYAERDREGQDFVAA